MGRKEEQPGLIEGGNTGWGGGVNSAVGVGGGKRGGGQQWGVSSTSKDRPSHHKYKYDSPKQFELKQS